VTDYDSPWKVEVQGRPDSEFPVRMYVYNYRGFDRYNRKVVSLAVLADEQRGWRPDRFGYSLWGCTIEFQFPVVKLLDYAERVEELERNPNPFAAVVLAHVQALKTRRNSESRRAWKVRLIKGLYERGLDREDIRRLFRLIDWIMELPKELDREFWSEIEKFEEARKMPYITSVERLGRAEGKKEGRKEGRREGLVEGIEVALRLKFGDQGRKILKILEELRAINDNALLGRILERIPEAKGLDELRKMAADR
jgi:hypothetical protein